MSIKVKVIAPYKGLIDLMSNLSKDQTDMQIDIEEGDLYEGLEIAKKAVKQGYDLLVSRGGTAALIRRYVPIPVIAIPVSGYDILRSLTLIKDYKGKIGIIGFENITEGSSSICQLLDLDIPHFTIHHESEVENALRQAISQGVEVVVGDVITVQNANLLGLQGILITSGPESVKETFENIRNVYRVFQKKEEERLIFENIMNENDRGILLVDENNRVKFFNNAIKQLIPTLKIGDFVDDKVFVIDMADQNARKDHFKITWQNNYSTIAYKKNFILNNEKMTIYYSIDFDIVQQMANEVNKQKLKKIDVKKDLANFGQFIKNSSVMKEVLEHAKKFAVLDTPLWLIGEYGTGKEMLAEAIHQASSYTNGPFVTFSFYFNDGEQIEKQLFGADNSPNLFELAQGGTLYLEGLEKAPSNIYSDIILELKKWPNLRLIYSSEISATDMVEADENGAILQTISPSILKIPTLRERTEDIEDLVRLFVAKYNIKYGKQIVGIKYEPLQLLLEYSWPRNVEELDKVIEEAVILTDEYYIDQKDLISLYNKYEEEDTLYKTLQNDKGAMVIHLENKTLDDIEIEIINHVLSSEKMNQSEAAKRLGINRTTLWRKIKTLK